MRDIASYFLCGQHQPNECPQPAIAVSFNPWLLYGNNMALMINDAHIPYYHMDTVWSILLGCTHFSTPEYLTVKAWVQVTFLFPDTVALTRPFAYRYGKVLLGLVRYPIDGLPCHLLFA